MPLPFHRRIFVILVAMAAVPTTLAVVGWVLSVRAVAPIAGGRRSEEHTSELQSRQYLVCRLLLEKKNARQGRPADRALALAEQRPDVLRDEAGDGEGVGNSRRNRRGSDLVAVADRQRPAPLPFQA